MKPDHYRGQRNTSISNIFQASLSRGSDLQHLDSDMDNGDGTEYSDEEMYDEYEEEEEIDETKERLAWDKDV